MPLVPTRRGGGTPERWDPFREIEDMYERMGRFLQAGFGLEPGEAAWSPLVDVEETDEAYVVEADLPGVKRDDVSV